jgi:SAM-dependent methyltransferase
MLMLRKLVSRIGRRFENLRHSRFIRSHEKADLKLRSGLALRKLLDEYEFESVLDVGCGSGEHSERFLSAGKRVTAVDYGNSHYFRQNRGRIDVQIGNFNEMEFDTQFDCVWCSHVLEHQLNVQDFLTKVSAAAREGGVLAITVPPLKHRIAGGHVSLWNGGLLLYRLVLAGLDCHEARVLAYNYNISALVRKRSISVLGELEYDRGDIRKIRPYLPPSLDFLEDDPVDTPFDGAILRLNW